MASSCTACRGKEHTAWHPDCKIHQKEKKKASAKLASIASRYPIRPRLEQNRACTPTPVTLDSNGYQIVTRKRKALRELAEAFLNMGAARSKLEKQSRLLSAARLTEKEPG